MVLHLEEFENEFSDYGKRLHYYDRLPTYLHEMELQELIEHINRNGVTSYWYQKKSVVKYLKWLFQTYNIDTIEQCYNINLHYKDETSKYIGFFSSEELVSAIEINLEYIRVSQTEFSNRNYNAFIALCYLYWYGLNDESILSIKLYDVSDDGRKVYVPLENITLEIDNDSIAEYFAEYKKEQSVKIKNVEVPYGQSTFIRSTSKKPISKSAIYNLKRRFVASCKDERFEKSRILNAGRYYRLMQCEQKLGYEFSNHKYETLEIFREVFKMPECTENTMYKYLRVYRKYKSAYLDSLSIND